MTIAKLRAQCVLLDIEGTVSDVRFVYDVMFPYAKTNMEQFLFESWESLPVQARFRPLPRIQGSSPSAIGLVLNGNPAAATRS